jgi:hypothetical protein
MKSIWERNIARYLEWLKVHKQIKEWEYEPKTFVFDAIKFGNRTYTPDFRITENSGKQHWLEVKGWMDPTSKTKLSRMARYFPAERVDVMEKKGYYALRRDLRRASPSQHRQRSQPGGPANPFGYFPLIGASVPCAAVHTGQEEPSVDAIHSRIQSTSSSNPSLMALFHSRRWLFMACRTNLAASIRRSSFLVGIAAPFRRYHQAPLGTVSRKRIIRVQAAQDNILSQCPENSTASSELNRGRANFW